MRIVRNNSVWRSAVDAGVIRWGYTLGLYAGVIRSSYTLEVPGSIPASATFFLFFSTLFLSSLIIHEVYI